MSNNIVKVRARQGTKSLDITIPASLSQDYDINAGDLFKVEVCNDKETIKITYTMIYKNNI